MLSSVEIDKPIYLFKKENTKIPSQLYYLKARRTLGFLDIEVMCVGLPSVKSCARNCLEASSVRSVSNM